MKLKLSPIGKMYIVCAILHNAEATSKSFGLQPIQGQRLEFKSGGGNDIVSKEAPPWLGPTGQENFLKFYPLE